MTENKRFKNYLIFQSFFPLFFLLFVKHFQLDYLYCVGRFFKELFTGNWFAFYLATTSPLYGDVIICIECLLWMLISFVIYLASEQKYETGNFDSDGVKIKIVEKKYDSGVSYLMTFVLPLMLDDLTTINGMITFYSMVAFVFLLVSNTNLFYANPVLAFRNYKVVLFSEENNQNFFIGISKGKIEENKIVKKKNISDDVYFIANDTMVKS